ncbi:BOLA3 (predicted) [Pycnogonum litorale]
MYLRVFQRRIPIQVIGKTFVSSPSTTDSERNLSEILQIKFPAASKILVSDVSGGCGAMYEVTVESSEFKGVRQLEQHRKVTEALKEKIKDMHGIRIFTSIPR